eukprot:5599872-Karenia_brevis.AAC.1
MSTGSTITDDSMDQSNVLPRGRTMGDAGVSAAADLSDLGRHIADSAAAAAACNEAQRPSTRRDPPPPPPGPPPPELMPLALEEEEVEHYVDRKERQ